jgi:hypothetical protein
MWTNNNKFTLSGPGSELNYAKNCIRFLIDFIKRKNNRWFLWRLFYGLWKF